MALPRTTDTPNHLQQEDFSGFEPTANIAIHSKKNTDGKSPTNEDRADAAVLPEFEVLKKLSKEQREAVIKSIMQQSVQKLVELVERDPLAGRCGSTLCVVLLVNEAFTWNVGDSVSYVSEQDAKQVKVERFTKAVHNVKHIMFSDLSTLTAEEKEERTHLESHQTRGGRLMCMIGGDDARPDPTMTFARLALSRTIGATPFKSAGLRSDPTFASRAINPAATTTFSAMSDGATDCYNQEDLQSFFALNAEASSTKLARTLTTSASEISTRNKNRSDDVTAAICKIAPNTHVNLPACFFAVYDGQGGPTISRLLRAHYRTILQNTARELIPAALQQAKLEKELMTFKQQFSSHLKATKEEKTPNSAEQKAAVAPAIPPNKKIETLKALRSYPQVLSELDSKTHPETADFLLEKLTVPSTINSKMAGEYYRLLKAINAALQPLHAYKDHPIVQQIKTMTGNIVAKFDPEKHPETFIDELYVFIETLAKTKNLDSVSLLEALQFSKQAILKNEPLVQYYITQRLLVEIITPDPDAAEAKSHSPQVKRFESRIREVLAKEGQAGTKNALYRDLVIEIILDSMKGEKITQRRPELAWLKDKAIEAGIVSEETLVEKFKAKAGATQPKPPRK